MVAGAAAQLLQKYPDLSPPEIKALLVNNGFRVVDLGIKVPPERLLAACREHKPDAVGLSGLLVKSAHQMVVPAFSCLFGA